MFPGCGNFSVQPHHSIVESEHKKFHREDLVVGRML